MFNFLSFRSNQWFQKSVVEALWKNFNTVRNDVSFNPSIASLVFYYQLEYKNLFMED